MSKQAADTGDAPAWNVIRAAVRLAEERLGDRLRSAYAIGSLAHGGFAPAVSDIDLALLTRELAPDMAQVVAEVSARVAATRELSLPDASHRSLAHDALGWRDLPTVPDPDDALRRISREIHHLHAEVFQRLGARPGTPRHDELAERARRLTVSA